MPRPMCDERVTLRLPSELLDVFLDQAARGNCSLNQVMLNALENDCARMATYSLSYYTDILPLMREKKGDNVRQ